VNAPLLVINLLLTVIFLAATIWAGRKGRRSLHYRLVVITVLLLAGAITQAELFGHGFTFEVLRLRIHLSFAFAALGSLPGVVWSGLALRTNPARRPTHRLWVGSFVSLTVLSVLTALWMLANAVPLDAA